MEKKKECKKKKKQKTNKMEIIFIVLAKKWCQEKSLQKMLSFLHL